jgi:hypothetical protein
MYKDFEKWWNSDTTNFRDAAAGALAAWDASAARFEGVVKALEEADKEFEALNYPADDGIIRPLIRAALKDLKGSDTVNGITDQTSPIIAK